MRALDRMRPLALLVMRVVVGIIFLMHGKGKIFGGMAHHMETVARIGFPAWFGYVSAGTEFFGGILLIAGLGTRFVGLLGCIEMCVVVLKVELRHGLVGGYEFPLTLAAINFALIWFGAGPISLDWLVGGKRHRE